jgi:hypothetical protein
MNLKKSNLMSQLERMSVLVFLIFLMGWRDYQMGTHGVPHPGANLQEVILVETSRGNHVQVAPMAADFC